MSKESRRRQRTASTGQTTTTGPAPSRPSTSPTGTSRAGRRGRARHLEGSRPSFFERYRTLLVGIGVVLVIGLAGIGIISAATQPAYACSSVWVPDPSNPPAEGSSPQPGYPQPDAGQQHIATGTAVTYTYCPPASGKHFNASGVGPIAPRAYGPDDQVNPQGWIHNLEHGGLVILYRGDGEGATEEGQAALRAFYERYPASPLCGFEPGTTVGPVFARFDDMATPYAALVWGRVLPLDALDEAAILAFDEAYGERTNPEAYCERPDPGASAAPSGSPAASPTAS